jgi:hypothetical protein
MLVEALVASTVLGGLVLLLASGTRATLALVDDAVLVSRLHLQATDRAERARVGACASVAPPLRRLHLAAPRSPLGRALWRGSDSLRLHVDLAGPCE